MKPKQFTVHLVKLHFVISAWLQNNNIEKDNLRNNDIINMYLTYTLNDKKDIEMSQIVKWMGKTLEAHEPDPEVLKHKTIVYATRYVNSSIKKGLITKTTSPLDKRKKIISYTKKAIEIFDLLDKAITNFEKDNDKELNLFK